MLDKGDLQGQADVLLDDVVRVTNEWLQKLLFFFRHQ